MHTADGHAIAVFERLPRDTLAVDEHPVGTIKILERGMDGARHDHRVRPTDVLGVDLQLALRPTSDTRSARQLVHKLGVAVGANQHALRPLDGRVDVIFGNRVEPLDTPLNLAEGRSRGRDFRFELPDPLITFRERLLRLNYGTAPIVIRTGQLLEFHILVAQLLLESLQGFFGRAQIVIPLRQPRVVFVLARSRL